MALGHPPFQGLVACAVYEEQPGIVDGLTREEVLRGKSHRVVASRNRERIFFPPSPPQEGRKGTGEIIVVKREL